VQVMQYYMYGNSKKHTSSAHEEMQGMWWPKETAHFIRRTESTSVTETRGTRRGKTDGRRV